ncbi:hypothetical protein HMPREF0880_04180 [Yokenella regensburgei ATCC 43003]|nr:hypothetical protein HMPREF0880_04180 [Yokenella regensburgei ATCC 43003]
MTPPFVKGRMRAFVLTADYFSKKHAMAGSAKSMQWLVFSPFCTRLVQEYLQWGIA